MDRRELRVVIGPNGAGKTTLLDVVSGRVKPESGRVIFGHETDLLPLRENDIARLGIGRKFQTPSVFVNLTVWDNVELSLRRASQGRARRAPPRDSGGGAGAYRSGRSTTVQLAAKADGLAGALAHGEKQWLEIGMVIAQDPELLLVDEPVAGMTDEETARTGELLETIAADRSVLVIEHDMEFVRQIARKVTVLHQGTILCEGPVEQVQSDPRVLEVYLGRRREATRCCPLSGLDVAYGESQVLWGVNLEVGAGRARVPDGAQRRGQDDAPQDRHRALAGAARDGRLRRGRITTWSPDRRARAGHRLRSAGP